MTEKLVPEAAIALAARMRGLASSEDFRLLVEMVRDDCHREWEAGKTAEAREEAAKRLDGIRSLEKQIRKVVDRGAAAAKALKRQKSQQTNNNT